MLDVKVILFLINIHLIQGLTNCYDIPAGCIREGIKYTWADYGNVLLL